MIASALRQDPGGPSEAGRRHVVSHVLNSGTASSYCSSPTFSKPYFPLFISNNRLPPRITKRFQDEITVCTDPRLHTKINLAHPNDFLLMHPEINFLHKVRAFRMCRPPK